MKLICAVLAFLCIGQLPGSGHAAAKYSYDSFYGIDAGFNKYDADLNSSFGKLTKDLDWAEKDILLAEQRHWRKRVFPRLVRDRAGDVKVGDVRAIDAAREAVRDRAAALAKLARPAQAEDILGMPIKFGMSEKEVSASLGDLPQTALTATPDNGQKAYAIRIFGEDVPVYFDFASTSIIPAQNGGDGKPPAFLSRMAGVLAGLGEAQKSQPGFKISSLRAVSLGEMLNIDDFRILNGELAKKYKRVYPASSRLLDFLASRNFFDTDELKELALGAAANNFLYEDRQRYVLVRSSWGNASGEFCVTFVSRPYLSWHVESANGLFRDFTQSARYESDLVILPDGATLAQVVTAIGGRELTWSELAGNYYKLSGTYPDGEGKVYVEVCMTPENRAFAVTFSYDGEEDTTDVIIERLTGAFKKLETPEDVVALLGHSQDADHDFESGRNFIHLGSAPHFASMREITVANREAAAKYRIAREAQDIRAEERARKDSARF